MIRQLKLTNFRKHEELVVTFAPGLNAIRGSNEAGKSTIILGVLYALYGAKALPEPLINIVTWGRKESELKVALTLEVDGRLFNFTRSKSGAEAAYDGGLVTGQNEVSNFAAEVLGGDRELVSRLMLANQSNLRGALQEGPKAVASMIEALADFDLFDRIINAAQQKLSLGPTTSLEERVRLYESEVVEATPEEPNLDAYVEGIRQEEIAQAAYAEQIAKVEPLKAVADGAHANAQTQKRMRDTMEGNLKKAVEQQKLRVVQKDEADKKAAVVVSDDEIAQLKKDLADINAALQRQDVHSKLQDFINHYPTAYWEGTKEEFTQNLRECEVERDAYASESQKLNNETKDCERDIAVLEAQVITATTCPTCGSDVSKNPDVLAKNTALQAQVEVLKERKLSTYARLAGVDTAKHNKVEEIAGLRAVQDTASPFEKFATQYGEYVVVDFNFYPPVLAWKGESPEGAIVDPKQIRERLVSQESAKEAVGRANARSVALAETLKEDAEYVARLEQQLADYPEVGSLDDLHAECRRLGNEIANLRYVIDTSKERAAALLKEQSEVEFAYTEKLKQKARTEEDLQKARKELDTLNFNNVLLKKVKTARPFVSDKLWAMTLSAVSTMFTSMRGEKSVVTKDSDGFAVNGKSVQGLSGSTLDILGLAIRVALIKTFLPHVSFLALDEPASAADVSRAAAMLGFLSASGFAQVLIVSHEEAAEAVADHVITL